MSFPALWRYAHPSNQHVKGAIMQVFKVTTQSPQERKEEILGLAKILRPALEEDITADSQSAGMLAAIMQDALKLSAKSLGRTKSENVKANRLVAMSYLTGKLETSFKDLPIELVNVLTERWNMNDWQANDLAIYEVEMFMDAWLETHQEQFE